MATAMMPAGAHCPSMLAMLVSDKNDRSAIVTIATSITSEMTIPYECRKS